MIRSPNFEATNIHNELPDAVAIENIFAPGWQNRSFQISEERN